MAREGVKIAIQSLDIHSAVHNALTTINHNVRSHAVCLLNYRTQLGTCTESIRCLRNGNHTSSLIKQLIQLLHHQATAIVKGQHTNLCTLTFGHQLPRHNIGVVFHLADDDIITLAQESLAPRIGDGIYRSGSSRREDYLLAIGSTYKHTHALARLLVELGCLLRKTMYATVDIGILLTMQTIHRLDNSLGLLRRSSTIEVDERLAIHLATENREIVTYAEYIHIIKSQVLQ